MADGVFGAEQALKKERYIMGAAAQPGWQPYVDPDGVSRMWPARSGRWFFRAGTFGPDSQAGWGYFSTYGQDPPAFTGGTIAFSFRFHVLPSQPVTIFRQTDIDIERTISLVLQTDGSLLLLGTDTPFQKAPRRMKPFEWHTLSLSYGPDTSRIVLSVDRRLEVAADLPFGAPEGDVSVGIVDPIVTPFSIGIDDYVEATARDAPIEGARVDYLMPHGAGSRSEWQQPLVECQKGLPNWTIVSEDQFVPCGSSPAPVHGSLRTSVPGAVDEFLTEGIPSVHVASASYLRAGNGPKASSRVLAVRTRVAGRTSAELLAPRDRVVVAAVLGDRELAHTFELTTYGFEKRTWWSRIWERQPTGAAWDVGSLKATRLSIRPGAGLRWGLEVAEVRLDYVWVP